MKKILCMLLTAVLAGCTNDSPEEPVPEICPVEEDATSGLLIDSRSKTVDSSDAVKVAMAFMGKESGHSRSQILALPQTETVTDPETGKELLHVVNWPGDGGFVIVSATKSAPPVLAFSETGNFPIGETEPASDLLEGLKMSVRALSELPEDSLLRINALNWALYEKPAPVSVLSRSISMEMQEKMNRKIAKMKAAGWNCAGNITAARYRLPDSEYEALFRDASQWSNPQYNIEEVSLCFIKEEKLNITGPLLTTQWHQEAPYNVVPVYRQLNINKKVAGCAPIAIAQIANYHRFPTKYKWDNLLDYSVNGLAMNLYELMGDISDYCKADFKEGRTSVSPGNDVVGIQKLGYLNASYNTVSLSLMSSMIKSKNPFYMRGEGSDGHAWVCDGYQERRFPGVISVVAVKSPMIDLGYDEETGYFDISFNYYSKEESAILPDYFHMNMGNGKNGGDGWYHYFDGKITGIKYPNNQRFVPMIRPK